MAENFQIAPSQSWRAPYGGDVGSTFVPGEQEQQSFEHIWKKPYVADAPAVVSSGSQPSVEATTGSGNSSEIDPLTGRPIVRNTVQATTDTPYSPLLDTSQGPVISQHRALVDRALDYNGVGVGGNLVAGGIGGVLGARTVPWLMNQATQHVSMDLTAAPTTLAERVTKYWRLNHDPSFWKAAELQLVPQADGAKSAMTAAELSAASGSKVFGYGQAILKGVGVAGSFMIVDHLADQLLFGKDQHNGIGDSINSALVPAALLIGPKTSMLKMGLVGAGAIVAGKLIGSSVSSREDPSYSRYFRQSTPESLLLAAEALLPMKPMAGLNWKRAALIGGTWLAFRGINALLDPPPQGETKDSAWDLLGEDAKKRTDGSMNDAINKFGALAVGDESSGLMAWTNVFKEGLGKTKGARGESALQVYRTEWLTKPTDQFGSMLEANRGAAILTTAFAESRLAHGTHVPTITDTPTYLLEGKNLDIGGKAARDFIIARINIENAKKQVQENLGKEIAGKTVEQSEIADLDSVKKRIEVQEAKIYGEHDMDAAIKELAKWGEGLNAVHMAKLEVDLRNTIAANQNSQDNRYKAKLFRDLATIYLATAYGKQDGDPQGTSKLLGGDTDSGRMALDMTGQQRGFDGALDCIARAAQLDDANLDTQQLYQIAQQINAKLPGNIQRQMTDGKYNPLQIRH